MLKYRIDPAKTQRTEELAITNPTNLRQRVNAEVIPTEKENTDQTRREDK
jgi:hypothetical protein